MLRLQVQGIWMQDLSVHRCMRVLVSNSIILHVGSFLPSTSPEFLRGPSPNHAPRCLHCQVFASLSGLGVGWGVWLLVCIWPVNVGGLQAVV